MEVPIELDRRDQVASSRLPTFALSEQPQWQPIAAQSTGTK
jgi:hypothetical protein